MHAFIIKRRYFSDKKRFIVMTENFIFNCQAAFTDASCNDIKFQSLKWRVPLKAMKSVSMVEESPFVKVSIIFDLVQVNEIMDKLITSGKKKKQKEKRSLKFSNIANTRDFIFHLKRLYHLHNNAEDLKLGKQVQPLKVTVDKK